MTAGEMVKIAREELRPGLVFVISAAGKDGDSMLEKYEVVGVYPNFVLAERTVRGEKVRRSFDNWTMLKLLGKIQPVDLRDLDCREKRKDGKATHARNLLEEEAFREACRLRAAGKLSVRHAAEMCNISYMTFAKYYAQYMAHKN